MKNAGDWIILVFIAWVLMHNQANAFIPLATKNNWNVNAASLFGGIFGGGAKTAAGSSSGGGGGFLGSIGNAFGFVPSVLGNLAGGNSASGSLQSGVGSAVNTVQGFGVL